MILVWQSPISSIVFLEVVKLLAQKAQQVHSLGVQRKYVQISW